VRSRDVTLGACGHGLAGFRFTHQRPYTAIVPTESCIESCADTMIDDSVFGLCRDTRLGDEAIDRVRRREPVRADHLQRDDPVELSLACSVDDAHRAPPDLI